MRYQTRQCLMAVVKGAWKVVLSFVMVILAGLEVVDEVFGTVKVALHVIKAVIWLVGQRLQRIAEWVMRQ